MALLSSWEFKLNVNPTGTIQEYQSPQSNPFAKSQGLDGRRAVEYFLEKLMLGHLTLPEEPISAGTSWTQKVKTKTTDGELKIEAKFSYAGEAERDGKVVQKISLHAKFIHANSAPEGDKCTGNIYLDNRNGRILETSYIETQTIRHFFSKEKISLSATMNLVK